MVHRACKLARACVPAVDPVAFTTDVRTYRTSRVASLDETAAITAVRSQPTAHIKAMRGPGRIKTKPQISERLEARLCTERRQPSNQSPSA